MAVGLPDFFDYKKSPENRAQHTQIPLINQFISFFHKPQHPVGPTADSMQIIDSRS